MALRSRVRANEAASPKRDSAGASSDEGAAARRRLALVLALPPLTQSCPAAPKDASRGPDAPTKSSPTPYSERRPLAESPNLPHLALAHLEVLAADDGAPVPVPAQHERLPQPRRPVGPAVAPLVAAPLPPPRTRLASKPLEPLVPARRLPRVRPAAPVADDDPHPSRVRRGRRARRDRQRLWAILAEVVAEGEP